MNATRTGAAIRMGRKPIPYAAPVEFGGWPHGGDHPRLFLKDGRYMFPTARGSNMATIAAAGYADAIDHVAQRFGWTNTTQDGGAVHD